MRPLRSSVGCMLGIPSHLTCPITVASSTWILRLNFNWTFYYRGWFCQTFLRVQLLQHSVGWSANLLSCSDPASGHGLPLEGAWTLAGLWYQSELWWTLTFGDERDAILLLIITGTQVDLQGTLPVFVLACQTQTYQNWVGALPQKHRHWFCTANLQLKPSVTWWNSLQELWPDGS